MKRIALLALAALALAAHAAPPKAGRGRWGPPPAAVAHWIGSSSISWRT